MWWGLGFVGFVLVATANGGGYRYGTSDQAFYIPAVIRVVQPAAFPRDAPLIDSQAHLMVLDEFVGQLVGVTRLPLDVVFLTGYVLSLLLIFLAIVFIGRGTYAHVWLTVALAAAFTLRHRIPRTSVNSFEPYFHPRMLAFGFGALAIAALLRRRFWPAIALVGMSALVHITTAVWFAVLVGVAMAQMDRRFRRLGIAAVAAGAVFLSWALVSGPLATSLATMDAAWLAAVADKDSLFASDWPIWAWGANLALVAVAWIALWGQERRPELVAAAWGATALVALFLATLPLVTARMALPVQLQISRVFWLVDFVALISLFGIVGRERVARLVAAVVVGLAVARGAYVVGIEHPERPLFAVHLPISDWGDAMRWVKRKPTQPYVLADPGHAWKYGTSVRVSAERDVFLEEVKDSAVAIYSREMALRYTERARAAADFEHMTVQRADMLASRYQLDYLVTEQDLALPVAYRNSRFRIYSLRR